jgi:hypothetical protein
MVSQTSKQARLQGILCVLPTSFLGCVSFLVCSDFVGEKSLYRDNRDRSNTGLVLNRFFYGQQISLSEFPKLFHYQELKKRGVWQRDQIRFVQTPCLNLSIVFGMIRVFPRFSQVLNTLNEVCNNGLEVKNLSSIRVLPCSIDYADFLCPKNT